MQDSTVCANKGLVQKHKRNEHEQPLEVDSPPPTPLKMTCYLTVSCPGLSVRILFTEVHESFPFHLSPSAATNPSNKNSFLFDRERTSALSFSPSANTSDYVFISDEKYLSVG